VVETVVDEVVGVNATSISTRGTLASRGTTKTHGMAHMVEGGIMGEGDTTNPQIIPTLPQLKLKAIRTEGTHRKTITRTTNRADTGDHLSRHMTHGLRINNRPTEVAGEGTIPDTMARTAARRMGTLEGEGALLPIEEVRRMVVAGMAIREVREGVMGMVAAVVDTTRLRRTVVTAEVATTEEEEEEEVVVVVAVITLVEATNPVGVISPVDHTAPVSSLTGTKGDTIKEVEVVGEGTDPADIQIRIRKRCSGLLRLCFPPALSRH